MYRASEVGTKALLLEVKTEVCRLLARLVSDFGDSREFSAVW